MLKEMAAVVKHSMHTDQTCIYNPEIQAYECLAPEAAAARALEILRAHPGADSRPSLRPQFKLVFITAAAGTALFVLLCVVLTFASGSFPGLGAELVRGLFALAQVGFGAIVGLLGGKAL